MTTSLLSVDDIVFNAGESPENPTMYLVGNDELQYTAFSGNTTCVSPAYWICEAALWTIWTHRGVLKATNNSRIYVLDSLKFQAISGSTERQTCTRSHDSE